MERMHAEVSEFIEYVRREMMKEEEGWKDRVKNALVKLPPHDLVKVTQDS
jgi:hypothetical protein